ncbi:MAG: hypothetical protein FJ041_07885 [Candidatus Cloacimonetes bacterium]|nr:hypothetical protein [Candidatus Cloacimonadota bacterium]
MGVHLFFTWVLFIGLFPFSFFWLRNAWKIFVLKEYANVALKGGKSPDEPHKYAFLCGLVNLLGGLVFAIVIVLILLMGLHYDTWSAIVGVTLWMKLLADLAISRYAHMKWKK